MHGGPEVRLQHIIWDYLGRPGSVLSRRANTPAIRDHIPGAWPGRTRPPRRKGRRKTRREGRPLPRPRTGKPKRGQPQPRFGRRRLLKKETEPVEKREDTRALVRLAAQELRARMSAHAYRL